MENRRAARDPAAMTLLTKPFGVSRE